jgi:beta-barrel assembly-enhancing protease
MLIYKKIATVLTIAGFLFASGLVRPPTSLGITIQEERELAKEFMAMVEARYELIKDPVIVDYVSRVGNRILASMPPQPYTYHFHVINEDVYNAFATPAGHIFINSGLFAALESEEELAGIIGHEIAHVVCRHISQRIESSKKIGMATLAGMVAGVLLGAGGAGAAASALTVGSVAAGQTAALAYSREDEMQADQLGLEYLAKSGYTGQGLLTSLEKIRSKQWYGSDQIPTYLATHPAAEARLSYIDSWLHHSHAEPMVQRPPTGDFKRVHTRVVALYTDANTALSHFSSAVASAPDDSMAHYGYALALTRADRWTEAAEHMHRALESNAMATDMLQDLGRIYFHSGQYENAIQALSVSQSEQFPEGQLYLGRTQLELGRYQDARETFDELVKEHADYTEAYYYLGESSGRVGDMFGAHFNLGRFYLRKKDTKNADFHLNRALKLAGSPSQQEMVKRELEELKSGETQKK